MATIYSDVFGSIARRQKQEEKDAAELARRVPSGFSPGTGAYLALRPVDERVAADPPRAKTAYEMAQRRLRRLKRRGHIGGAELKVSLRRLDAMHAHLEASK